jgi:hypothetical protein
MLAHRREVFLADEIRRKNARRITGVDTGILDVLHDSTDYDLITVGDRVDIGLVRILEKAVDQDWPVLRNARCALEVILE